MNSSVYGLLRDFRDLLGSIALSGTLLTALYFFVGTIVTDPHDHALHTAASHALAVLPLLNVMAAAAVFAAGRWRSVPAASTRRSFQVGLWVAIILANILAGSLTLDALDRAERQRVSSDAHQLRIILDAVHAKAMQRDHGAPLTSNDSETPGQIIKIVLDCVGNLRRDTFIRQSDQFEAATMR